MTDRELFDLIMSRWVSYYSKRQAQEEIAKTGECLEGRIFDFKGDIPQSSDFKFDTVGPRVDRARRIYISQDEQEAVELVRRLPSRLRPYLQVEALMKRGATVTQEQIALLYFNVNVETYRTARKRAMSLLVALAKEKYQRIAKAG